MTGALTRRGDTSEKKEEVHAKTEEEIRIMQPQIKEHQELPESPLESVETA